ncbi:MAG: hypothetical protein ACE5J6_03140 [Candidatus Bathyarchaeia archaeon]
MAVRVKFILFSIGLGTAVASSITSICFLYISLLGGQSLVYESNPILALVEMMLLVLGVGTCLVASEVYYRYLEMRKSGRKKK